MLERELYVVLQVAEPVVNAADAKGTNVNDKVTASNLQLQKTTFDPNQSGNIYGGKF